MEAFEFKGPSLKITLVWCLNLQLEMRQPQEKVFETKLIVFRKIQLIVTKCRQLPRFNK